jgi:hypothetical protein
MVQDAALPRLNKLVAKGFTVQWGAAEQDYLRLEHPKRDVPTVMLRSDGTVDVLHFPPREEDWIAADAEADERRFNSFLASVPEPTMFQSVKSLTIEAVWIRTMVWCCLMVFTVAFALLAGWVWRLMTRSI